ncbi:cadherin-like beta sandwich domain-containing protein [Eubacterium oxidoreducens]|nr:cadherin-like beta sandwich domain-containing protein [Eubacterium oxidoreducens]
MRKIGRFVAAVVLSTTVLCTVSAIGTTQVSATTTTQTTDTKSKDNSLSSLSLSEGTLSPSFKYSTTSYTATVPNEVTKVEVNATLSNSKATIKSIKGNDNLQVGENTIKITTKSEAGTKAVYTIVVTRQEATSTTQTTDTETTEDTVTAGASSESAITYQEDGTFLIDDATYNVSQDFTDDKIPSGFARATVDIGTELTGMQDSASGVKLLYLVNAADANDTRYIVVDETAESYENYLKLESDDHYVIVTPVPIEGTVPDNYTKASLEVKGVTLTLYEPSTGGAFYLFYGVNQEGTGAWYQYDASEETYQRYNEDLSLTTANSEYISSAYDELKEKYEDLQGHYRVLMGIAFAAIVAIIILVINRLIRGRQEDDEEDDEEKEDKSVLDFGDDKGVLRFARKSKQEKEVRKEEQAVTKETPKTIVNDPLEDEPIEDPRKDFEMDDFEEADFKQPLPVSKEMPKPKEQQKPADLQTQTSQSTNPKPSDKPKTQKKQMDFDDIMDLNDL